MIHDPILQSTISLTFNDPTWDLDFDNLTFIKKEKSVAACHLIVIALGLLPFL